MYKFIKIRHTIIKQCHGNYKEMKKYNYKIEIFRNSTQILLGVLRGSFQWFGCPKRHQEALLAKTMADHVLVMLFTKLWNLRKIHTYKPQKVKIFLLLVRNYIIFVGHHKMLILLSWLS